jgi:NAD(P)-dependent dehydrogenase (short-subunit alcohol dehydrogenase family)
VIASRKLENLTAAADELSKELQLKENVCEVFKCNIREETEVKALFEFANKRFGKVDFLVNNSGGQFPLLAEEISPNGWRSVVDLNLNGTFIMCREAFRSGMGERGGSIVNIVCEMNSGFPGMVSSGYKVLSRPNRD